MIIELEDEMRVPKLGEMIFLTHNPQDHFGYIVTDTTIWNSNYWIIKRIITDDDLDKLVEERIAKAANGEAPEPYEWMEK